MNDFQLIPYPIYETWINRVSNSRCTTDSYSRIVRDFETHIRSVPVTLDNLRDVVTQYVTGKEKKDGRGYVINARSVNLVLTALRSLFNELAARNFIRDNPLAGFKQYHVPKFSNKASVTEPEMYALLDDLHTKSVDLKSARNFVIVYFLYMYALRVSSLTVLQYPTDGQFLIWQKRNRLREEIATENALEVLSFWKGFEPKGKYIVCKIDPYGKAIAGPVTTRLIQRIIKEIAPELTTHSFRKSFAEHCIASGDTRWEIANAMGCEPKQVDYYSHNKETSVLKRKGFNAKKTEEIAG